VPEINERNALMIPDSPMMTVPLRPDDSGAIRIGASRVLLEIVIRAFERGETPEGIVQSFPSLKLDEVYAVISYYLQNRAEVAEYMRQVEQDSQRIREQIEAAQPDMSDLRARLLKRLKQSSCSLPHTS
jgi:uncharacterized protein (DUF433 family)